MSIPLVRAATDGIHSDFILSFFKSRSKPVQVKIIFIFVNLFIFLSDYMDERRLQ